MANGNVILCGGRLNQWEVKGWVGRGRGKEEMCLHLKMSHEAAGAPSPYAGMVTSFEELIYIITRSFTLRDLLIYN